MGMRFLTILLVLLATGCSSKKPEIWIYTSIYKEVIAELEGPLQDKFPEVKIQWFQGGSEVIAMKTQAELAGGGTRADLFLTSDPFWYIEMKKAGHLAPYTTQAAQGVNPKFSDPDHYFEVVRIPVMVLAYNSKTLPSEGLPERWTDLQLPQWKDKLSVANPMESGTAFTTIAMLSRKYGWEYLKTLRKHNMLVSGGNSSVITRIETGERPVGIVLLESVLKAQSKGSPIKPIYPLDGAIPIPSPIAISKSTKNLELSRKIYDWFFTPEAQNALVTGGMYSPLLQIAHPAGARDWKSLSSQLFEWSPYVAEEILRQRDTIRTRAHEILLQ